MLRSLAKGIFIVLTLALSLPILFIIYMEVHIWSQQSPGASGRFVYAENNKPIEGARISVTCYRTNYVHGSDHKRNKDFELTTDSNGEFEYSIIDVLGCTSVGWDYFVDGYVFLRSDEQNSYFEKRHIAENKRYVWKKLLGGCEYFKTRKPVFIPSNSSEITWMDFRHSKTEDYQQRSFVHEFVILSKALQRYNKTVITERDEELIATCLCPEVQKRQIPAAEQVRRATQDLKLTFDNTVINVEDICGNGEPSESHTTM